MTTPRITGLKRKDAPWHLRWFYGLMRKMFGQDLTPVKVQMRVPGIVWDGIALEAGLGRKRLLLLRYIQRVSRHHGPCTGEYLR